MNQPIVKQAVDAAYNAIRDEAHIADIVNAVRDGEGKNPEFDSQLARLLINFPEAAQVLSRLPGNVPEHSRIALVAVMQAISRIERLLYAEAFEDEMAAREAMPDNVIQLPKEQAA